MDKTEVKPTWRLVWGLWWKMFLISLALYAIIGLIMFFTVSAAFLPFLGGW